LLKILDAKSLTEGSYIRAPEIEDSSNKRKLIYAIATLSEGDELTIHKVIIDKGIEINLYVPPGIAFPYEDAEGEYETKRDYLNSLAQRVIFKQIAYGENLDIDDDFVLIDSITDNCIETEGNTCLGFTGFTGTDEIYVDKDVRKALVSKKNGEPLLCHRYFLVSEDAINVPELKGACPIKLFEQEDAEWRDDLDFTVLGIRKLPTKKT
jgi:hypothetical protein